MTYPHAMDNNYNKNARNVTCTINSKINGTPKGIYLPISKLHSVLVVVYLLAHNNLWLCYYGQGNSLRLKSSVASILASTHFGGTIYFAVDGTISVKPVLFFPHLLNKILKWKNISQICKQII